MHRLSAFVAVSVLTCMAGLELAKLVQASKVRFVSVCVGGELRYYQLTRHQK